MKAMARLPRHRAAPLAKQGGAATLVVVMVLFFIMTMMAAYANRNLIFEQRISANHYRATLAFEMAEAGLDWAATQLNSGQIDQQCVAASAANGSSFRQRYLSVADDSGLISTKTWNNPSKGAVDLRAGCIRTSASGWACHCPSTGTVNLPEPEDATVQPVFTVSFIALPQAGSFRLLAKGCSDIGTQCQVSGGNSSDSVAEASVVMSLVSALKLPPTATLTASGDVDLTLGQFQFYNTTSKGNGVTVRWGGNLTADAANQFVSLPGAPAEASKAKDEAMFALRDQADKTFAKYFGMFQATYRDQPAVTQITCDADCGPQLNSAWAGGARLLWVNGDLSISSPVTLGTAADPVVLISSGKLRISGASAITGLVYANGDAEWADALIPQSTLTGALVTRGTFTGKGAAQLFYDPDVISRLNLKAGSFVRVPGSWTDLK